MLATDNVIAVVGAGLTGSSCVRYLQARGQGCVVYDELMPHSSAQKFRQEYPDVELVTGKLAVGALDNYSQLLVSPGISLDQPAVAAAAANGVSVSGDIDLFCTQARAPIVAITGSNGKSTVTRMVGDMAAAAELQPGVGGNIGEPVLDLLADDEQYQIYVLELSSYQLERCSELHGHIATVLNISPDHMDRYSSLASYQAAKHRIYSQCTSAIYNRADEFSQPRLGGNARLLSFGMDAPDQENFGLRQHESQTWLARGLDLLIPTAELALRGSHNIENALAALALGTAADIPMEPMLQVLRSFTGLPHRCQLISQSGGVHWYDDSKGTNVGATLAAISGLEGERIVLIAGGVAKGTDFSPLLSVAVRLRSAVLIGEAAPVLADTLSPAVSCEFADNMVDAVAMAQHRARPGDAVLLSPACASFDMFDNFQHRGQVFAQAVADLQGGLA
jgi:UDP-N-acetylmuramoylalanine--D-glutamate ligase